MIRKLSTLALPIILILASLSPAQEASTENVEANILEAEALRDSSTLSSLLESESPVQRERVLLALGRIGDPNDAEAILPYLQDSSAELRGAAAFSLGLMFDQRNVQTYGGEANEAVVEALERALADSDESVAALAAEALGKIGADGAGKLIGPMLGALPNEESPEVDARARLLATALMRLKAADQVDVLIEAANHPSPAVQAVAVTMLGRMAKSMDEATRKRAAEAVRAKLGGAPWEAMPQVDDQMQAEAAKALGQLGSAEDVAGLAQLIDRPNQHLGIEATRAVAALGGAKQLQDAFAVLADEALADEKWVVKQGSAANRLIVLLQGLAVDDEELAKALSEETLDRMNRLRALPNQVGFQAMESYSLVMRALETPERAMEFPDGYRLNTIPALRAHVAALAEVGSQRTNFELFRLYDAKDAPAVVKKRVEAIKPHLVGAISKSMYGFGKYDERMDFLLGVLQASKNPLVRAVAAAELAPDEEELENYPAGLAKNLITAYRADTSKDPEARLALLEALRAGLGLEEVHEAFEDALGDPSPIVRRYALKILDQGTPENYGKFLRGTGPDLAAEAAQEPWKFYGDAAELENTRVVAVVDIQDRGRIVLELLPKQAPLTVNNFVHLAKKGTYNGIPFHRVVPDFVVQGGDPHGDGWGGPGYMIPCEINSDRFDRGSVGMAHAGKDTGGSQFFICHSPQPHLDGGYTVFGRMIMDSDDMPQEAQGAKIDPDFLDEIVAEDVIEKVTILDP
ncbi:peptidylprolyl isomerase [bacterium]|nr:peptidylprolyl isomerase [bacterium]